MSTFKLLIVAFLLLDIAFICWGIYRGLSALGHLFGFGVHVLFGGNVDSYRTIEKEETKQ